MFYYDSSEFIVETLCLELILVIDPEAPNTCIDSTGR